MRHALHIGVLLAGLSLAPDGTFVWGRPVMAPDGTFVGSTRTRGGSNVRQEGGLRVEVQRGAACGFRQVGASGGEERRLRRRIRRAAQESEGRAWPGDI
jgi:hypothetical protein